MRVLLVLSEPAIANCLKKKLATEFVVDVVLSPDQTLAQIELYQPALAIIDADPDAADEQRTCPWLKAVNYTTDYQIPTICLVDKNQHANYGADEYLIKPFTYMELKTKVRILLKKHQITGNILTIDKLTLNLSEGKITFDQQSASLTRKELLLIELFMRHPNQVLTKNMIIRHVWECPCQTSLNCLEVHISRLRKKLNEKLGLQLITTIAGFGYKLNRYRAEANDSMV